MSKIIWNNYTLMFGEEKSKKPEPRKIKYLYTQTYKDRLYYLAQVNGKYVASGYDVEVVKEKLSNYLREQAT